MRNGSRTPRDNRPLDATLRGRSQDAAACLSRTGTSRFAWAAVVSTAARSYKQWTDVVKSPRSRLAFFAPRVCWKHFFLPEEHRDRQEYEESGWYPANAILNYLYAILEAEARIACLTLGLDPGLGIWHADYRSRDSLALDLMEASRPDVDHYVLELLRTRTFSKKDFGETSRGICRLLPPFTYELAQTASQWRDAVAPHAEHVARLLAKAPGSRVDQLSTPLTGENRSKREADRLQYVAGRRDPVKPSPTCKGCGGPVPRSQRVYCDPCFALIRSTPKCKTCGGPVRHRKRVYCEPCLAIYRAELPGGRRACKDCQKRRASLAALSRLLRRASRSDKG